MWQGPSQPSSLHHLTLGTVRPVPPRGPSSPGCYELGPAQGSGYPGGKRCLATPPPAARGRAPPAAHAQHCLSPRNPPPANHRAEPQSPAPSPPTAGSPDDKRFRRPAQGSGAALGVFTSVRAHTWKMRSSSRTSGPFPGGGALGGLARDVIAMRRDERHAVGPWQRPRSPRSQRPAWRCRPSWRPATWCRVATRAWWWCHIAGTSRWRRASCAANSRASATSWTPGCCATATGAGRGRAGMGGGREA